MDAEQHKTVPEPAEQPTKPPLTEQQDARWAILAHLGGVLGFLPSLLIVLLLADRGPRTHREASEALSFQWTICVPVIVLYLIAGLTTGIPVAGWGISVAVWILAGAVLLFGAVSSCIAAWHTARTGTYRYRFAVRLREG
ncbi:MAG TPA: DUF4870 domain-containing protein [Pseudoclavibacter sp.]|nr:DUF4870 domain-containing protein [Pseudoclavibacter sp.]